jgi:hypothetical protein
MTAARRLLQELCEHLKLPAPPTSDDGECVVGIDYGEELVVFVSADDAELMLYSRVGVLGSDQTELLEQLFDANLLWQGTGAATLAFERYSRAVVLQQRMGAEGQTMQGLEQQLKTFADEAERWGQAIVSAAGSPSEIAPTFMTPA